jgi:hypothetical protein
MGMKEPRRKTKSMAMVKIIFCRRSLIFHAVRKVSSTLYHLCLTACCFDLFYSRFTEFVSLDHQAVLQFSPAQDFEAGLEIFHIPASTSTSGVTTVSPGSC